MRDDHGSTGAGEDPRDRELAALRSRVAELEAAARSEPVGPGLAQQQRLLQAIVDNSPAVIFVRDHGGRYLLINRCYELLFGLEREGVLGKTDHDLFPREVADQFASRDRQVLATGVTSEVEEVVPVDGVQRTYITLKFPIHNLDGSAYAVCGIATDITERKRGEQERAALQQEVLATQEAMIRELSSPLIPLADGVVALPIVGTVDRARAGQILQTVLEGVAQRRARAVILDITGVKHIDGEVAHALLQTTRAVRLLGAEVVLTGISGAVARSLVDLQADLSGVVTLGTLQDGIAHALRRRA